MSIPRQANVSCPKCGKKFLTTTFESVNTDNSFAQIEKEQRQKAEKV